MTTRAITVYICDRCDTRLELRTEYDNAISYSWGDIQAKYFNGRSLKANNAHLCIKCMNELIKWWDAGK